MQAAETIVDSQGGRMEVWPCGRPANGAHYRFERFLAPEAAVAPDHFHPHQEERVEVVSGSLAVRLHGRLFRLEPGEQLVIPPGTPHTLANRAGCETHLRQEFVPGLEIHRFFEAFFAIERSNRGLLRIVRWALLCSDRPEYIGFRPTLGVLVRLTAACGRALGLRRRRRR